jgi:2-hydroxychromene-2-carboxylate isomerase
MELLMTVHQIDCWITLGSTYSYLTVIRLPEVERSAEIAIQFRPFNLGAIFKDLGCFPFPPKSPKTAYMWQDMQRRADMYGISINLPVPYPAKNSALANTVALIGMREGWGRDFIVSSYREWFENGLEPGSDLNLAASLKAAGQDADRLIALAAGDQGQSWLKQETDVARALGVFGSPTFTVGEQLFWGDDRLEDAASWARLARVERPEVLSR